VTAAWMPLVSTPSGCLGPCDSDGFTPGTPGQRDAHPGNATRQPTSSRRLPGPGLLRCTDEQRGMLFGRSSILTGTELFRLNWTDSEPGVSPPPGPTRSGGRRRLNTRPARTSRSIWSARAIFLLFRSPGTPLTLGQQRTARSVPRGVRFPMSSRLPRDRLVLTRSL